MNRGLSAGRVQSPSIRLIVERERDRMAFVPAGYWDVDATFARNRLHLKRAALLIDATSPYSVGLAEYFTKTFTTLGGEIPYGLVQRALGQSVAEHAASRVAYEGRISRAHHHNQPP